jgi:aspartyl-tRNA(Asn)/glutamyl-tRNA(Gln) amidotransferase subunit B
MEFEPVIGLEIHAQLLTDTKIFCGCSAKFGAAPNTHTCPVCLGMPGVLPVLNRKVVEFMMKMALATNCRINRECNFARKNYFYPDLPKGYQITQYEHPLAEHGTLLIRTDEGGKTIRIRRVHLEEDTGKLTHVDDGSLVDLNRAGVPLLEIVSEPDLHSVKDARLYAEALRDVLRYLQVNSGDMEKGVIRFEANVSIRKAGDPALGKRVEIKNLNSFRALERASAFELERQAALLDSGGTVEQETLGWDDLAEKTYSQRSKEEAHDYRYFPEPDLPPLVLDDAWIEQVRAALPELPLAKHTRFVAQHGLSDYAAARLVEQRDVADYFEASVRAGRASPKAIANWIVGELFAIVNQLGAASGELKIPPGSLAELVGLVEGGEINQSTGKQLLLEMYSGGQRAIDLVEARGLRQVSDAGSIARLVTEALTENPQEVASYLAGKAGVVNFLFGQAMKKAAGKANPQVVKSELEKQLSGLH